MLRVLMKHIAKIAIASCVMAALTFTITYFVEWPAWRRHDGLYREQLSQAKEAMRRGEDPFLYQEIDVYCGLTPLQLARNFSFLVLVIAPPALLFASCGIRYIWEEYVLHEPRSN